jgi:hypothetical protein
MGVGVGTDSILGTTLVLLVKLFYLLVHTPAYVSISEH